MPDKKYKFSIGKESGDPKEIIRKNRKSGGEKVVSHGKGGKLTMRKKQSGGTTKYRLTKRYKGNKNLVGIEHKQTAKGEGSKSSLEHTPLKIKTEKTYVPFEERQVEVGAKSYGKEKPGHSKEESPEHVKEARRKGQDISYHNGKPYRAGFTTDIKTTATGFTPKIKVTPPKQTRELEVTHKVADSKTPPKVPPARIKSRKKRIGCSPNATGMVSCK